MGVRPQHISPGAALIFLITVPATNAATLTTLWSIIGRKQLAVFLITLAASALAAGFVMNLINPQLGIEEQICHSEGSGGPLRVATAIALIAVLINGLLPRKKQDIQI